MSQFLSGLKSRSDEVRLRTARELQKFVSTELRELPAEGYGSALDEINQVIFSLISSPEVYEKKGGILTIGKGERGRGGFTREGGREFRVDNWSGIRRADVIVRVWHRIPWQIKFTSTRSTRSYGESE